MFARRRLRLQRLDDLVFLSRAPDQFTVPREGADFRRLVRRTGVLPPP